VVNQIDQIGAAGLARYGQVSIAFEVRSIYEVAPIEGGLGGLLLRETPVAAPYTKDYDAVESPEAWEGRFNLDPWGIFLASASQGPLGAACVAFDTVGLEMLEGRDNLAVLWDIRVQPSGRGQGTGTQLFWHAVEWARARGCTQLKIETQNTNVPACKFYAQQGCILGSINRYGYASTVGFAHESMLLWYIDL